MLYNGKVKNLIFFPGGVVEWFKALVLKTSVSARAPWVRIPPPPLSTTDFYKNLSLGSFFIAYYLSLILLDFGKFSVTKVKKVAHFRLTNLKFFLLTVELK